jgi:hypothetical protein
MPQDGPVGQHAAIFHATTFCPQPYAASGRRDGMHQDAQLSMLHVDLARQSAELHQLLQQLEDLPPDLAVWIDESWLENFEQLASAPGTDSESPMWAIRG